MGGIEDGLYKPPITLPSSQKSISNWPYSFNSSLEIKPMLIVPCGMIDLVIPIKSVRSCT